MAAVPLTVTAVLGVEVFVAARGQNLPTPPTPTCPTPEMLLPVPRAVWLGDSTAAGVGATTPNLSLPCQVAAATTPMRIDVLAVSGARISDVIHEQLPRMAGIDAKTVFISVGANDTTHLSSTDDFRARYRRLLDALPAQANVVALGVPDMGAPPRLAQPLRAFAGWRGRALDRVIRQEVGRARRDRITYVDIAGATGPAFRRQPKRYFAADRFHPSDDGYALWAKAVTDQWRP